MPDQHIACRCMGLFAFGSQATKAIELHTSSLIHAVFAMFISVGLTSGQRVYIYIYILIMSSQHFLHRL